MYYTAPNTGLMMFVCGVNSREMEQTFWKCCIHEALWGFVSYMYVSVKFDFMKLIFETIS